MPKYPGISYECSFKIPVFWPVSNYSVESYFWGNLFESKSKSRMIYGVVLNVSKINWSIFKTLVED